MIKNVWIFTSYFLYFAISGFTQNFNDPIVDPLGIEVIHSNSSPCFVDIDDDDDYDLFSGSLGSTIYYYENIGNKTNPDFSQPQENPFGIEDVIYAYSTPTFVDIDNDNDFDLFVGSMHSTIYFFENIGNKTNPAFSQPQTYPFGIEDVIYAHSTLSFVDIDNDNDYDLFAGSMHASIIFFENIGNNTNPDFSQPQSFPFGIEDVIYAHSAPSFVDIDNDNDFDLFAGSMGSIFYFFENTGNNSTPSFADPQENPFGIENVIYSYSFPFFIDINGDNDYDLFSGSSGSIYYFSNSQYNFLEENNKDRIVIFPNPASSNIYLQSNIRIEKLTIYKLSGEIIFTTNKMIENISFLERGNYIFEVQTKSKIYLQKVLKL
jgi:predicted lactoylglutathione lyase